MVQARTIDKSTGLQNNVILNLNSYPETRGLSSNVKRYD